MNTKRWKRIALQAVKIGIGSSAAIYLAELLQLKNAASAGTIALLTIVATKRDTIHLSFQRIITFLGSIMLSWLTLTIFHSEWVAYGVYIFLVVFLSEGMGWKATISVNAVIGSHFLIAQDFSWQFISNELYLVLLGITLAIILNQFQNNSNRQKHLEEGMLYVEEHLSRYLDELSEYLFKKPMRQEVSVWEEVTELENEVMEYLADAHAYNYNTYAAHTEYYVHYFEMRVEQCGILHNLHSELKKMQEMPEQAAIVANYVLYLSDYIGDPHTPYEQMVRLKEIVDHMKSEPLPKTRKEFEARACLYHVLMELEEFLIFNQRFVEILNDKQKELYRRHGKKDKKRIERRRHSVF